MRAVELDARFGSVLAFLQDDIQRRRPTVGLLAGLTTSFVAQLPERRRALGRLGRLRRSRLVRALPATLEIDEELVLGPHVLDALLGSRVLEPRDPLERTDVAPPLPASIDPDRLVRIGEAMRAGAIAIVGVWGRAGHEAVVRALADRLRMRVRVPPPLGDDPSRAIAEAADDAAALGQLLWIDCDAVAHHAEALDVLTRATVPVCLTGTQPIRSASP